MKATRRIATALTVVALASLASVQAATLSAGQTYELNDPASGNLADPGVSLASDPSYAGVVVASASRALSMTITVTQNSFFGFPTSYDAAFSGEVDDWVVRRNDTGTLDFYTQLRVDPSSALPFGGSIDRPLIDMGSASAAPVTVGYRNDLPPGASAQTPTSISRSGDGQTINEFFRAWDQSPTQTVNPNSVSVATFFRSTSTSFIDGGVGQVNYFATYDSTRSGAGSSTFAFFAPTVPVPEPSSMMLMFAGAMLVWGVRYRNRG